MAYSTIVQKQLAAYKSWADDAIKEEHHARMIDSLVAEFPNGHYHNSVFGSLTVTYQLDSSVQLERMLMWLKGFGYRSIKGKDEPALKRRTFQIQNRNTRTKYRTDFVLEAYFLNEDGDCKYVKVGTKTVEAKAAVPEREVDVFELQCDDPAVEVAPVEVSA